jgi:hypothetical protein
MHRLKKLEIDTKRLEAQRYFDSLCANSSESSNVAATSFWTANRVKILLCMIVMIFAVCFTAFIFQLSGKPVSGKAVLFLVTYAYILTPAIGYFRNKIFKKKVKKTLFIKIASRVYKQSEIPKWFLLNSIFSMVLFGGITKIFNIGANAVGDIGILLFLLTPFLTYHLLCFIGDHPLSIFKAQPYVINNGHYGPFVITTNQSNLWSESSDSVNPYQNPSGLASQQWWFK